MQGPGNGFPPDLEKVKFLNVGKTCFFTMFNILTSLDPKVTKVIQV